MLAKPYRGEIWFVELDPVRGREQAKKRPCLVISANAFNTSNAELAIVVPLTSKKKNISSHVPLYPPEGGLITISFAMCEQIRSVSTGRFSAGCIGKATLTTLHRVEQIVKMLLDFNH